MNEEVVSCFLIKNSPEVFNFGHLMYFIHINIIHMKILKSLSDIMWSASEIIL